VAVAAVREGRFAEIVDAFHAEHNRMYGYSLEQEGTPIELINVRLRAVGLTEKPVRADEPFAGSDPAAARKGEREVFLPGPDRFATVPVFDGHRTRHGFRIDGPAVIEQVNTTLFLSSAFDCVCDLSGSFAVYLKDREDLVAGVLAAAKGPTPESES